MTVDTSTQLIEMIFPDAANHYGTLFGGNALALMSKAAFAAATRYFGSAVVLARSERADFNTPVRVGEMLELTAEVVHSGNSSMTVNVVGNAIPVPGGTKRVALLGNFKLVAVDADGRPQPIVRHDLNASKSCNQGQTE